MNNYTLLDKLEPLPANITYVATAKLIADEMWLSVSGVPQSGFAENCVFSATECSSPWRGYWQFKINVDAPQQQVAVSINHFDTSTNILSDYPIKIVELRHDPVDLSYDNVVIT